MSGLRSSQIDVSKRKEGFDGKGTFAEDGEAIRIVESFGLLPLGIQRGLGATADLFLFKDEYGSTVGIPLAEVCETLVQAKLLESRHRWEQKLRSNQTASDPTRL